MKSDGEMRQGGMTRIFIRPPLIRQQPHMTGAPQQERLEVGKSVRCETRTEFYDKRLKGPLQGQGRAVYQTSAYESRLEKHFEQ